MALLRLIAFALALAVAACRASEASPTSGLVAPPGWRALPALATAAAETAKQAKLATRGSEAWGDPARGCYSAWVALPAGRGSPRAVADKLVAGLRAEPALVGLAITNIVSPVPNADAGALALSFERAPYRGRMRASIAKAGIDLVACFWNEREPVACEAGCTQLIGSMR